MVLHLIFLLLLGLEYDTCYALQLYSIHYVEFVLLRNRVCMWLNGRIWRQWQ